MTTKYTPATPPPFTLRSHEVNATYTILKDGEPLGFTEHCNAVTRLNAYPKLVEQYRDALTLLSGWIETKSRPRFKAEHRADLAKKYALLRSLGEDA